MRGNPSKKIVSVGREDERASSKSDRPGTAADESVALARYNVSLKEAAIAEVDKRRLQNPRDRSIYREVASQIGVGEQSLRLWVKKKDAEQLNEHLTGAGVQDGGRGRAVSAEQMQSELQTLRRQIQKLRTENDVLKRAFVVFSSEWGGDK